MAARVQNRLTARVVDVAKTKGFYPDGNGLYLSVSATGAKSWVFRFRANGARRDMGLGSAASVALAEARRLAADARAKLAQAMDPLEARAAERKATEEAKVQAEARRITFGELADEHLATMSSSCTTKYYTEWKRALEVLAADLRPLPVADIDTEKVLGVLKPLWLEKPVTAKLLRARVAAVFDRARAKKLRTGENPAAWTGHLKLLLPKRSKQPRRHFPALAYQRLPDFIGQLREEKSIQALAAEFVVLTAVRVGEATSADWSEIDRAAKLWVVPARRMKLRIEHRVPLSTRALAIVDELKNIRQGAALFPSLMGGKRVHKTTVLRLIQDLAPGSTTHGMRSSFRDWAAEETNFSRETAEQCLAHRLGDDTERSYKRGDMLEKRRKLMEAWANYIEPRTAAKVIPLAKAKR